MFIQRPLIDTNLLSTLHRDLHAQLLLLHLNHLEMNETRELPEIESLLIKLRSYYNYYEWYQVPSHSFESHRNSNFFSQSTSPTSTPSITAYEHNVISQMTQYFLNNCDAKNYWNNNDLRTYVFNLLSAIKRWQVISVLLEMRDFLNKIDKQKSTILEDPGNSLEQKAFAEICLKLKHLTDREKGLLYCSEAGDTNSADLGKLLTSFFDFYTFVQTTRKEGGFKLSTPKTDEDRKKDDGFRWGKIFKKAGQTGKNCLLYHSKKKDLRQTVDSLLLSQTQLVEGCDEKKAKQYSFNPSALLRSHVITCSDKYKEEWQKVAPLCTSQAHDTSAINAAASSIANDPSRQQKPKQIQPVLVLRFCQLANPISAFICACNFILNSVVAACRWVKRWLLAEDLREEICGKSGFFASTSPISTNQSTSVTLPASPTV